MNISFRFYCKFIFIFAVIFRIQNTSSETIQPKEELFRDDINICKSYSNMSIYIYKIPPSILNKITFRNTTLYFYHETTCNYGPDPGYFTEYYIHHELAIREKSLNLSNDHPVSYYFIPQYPVCALHMCKYSSVWKLRVNVTQEFCDDVSADYVNTIMDYVIQNFPYFNRSRGSDHVLINAFDYSVYMFRNNPKLLQKLENVITMQNLGYINPPIANNEKDLLVVPYMQKNSIPILPSTPSHEILNDFKSYLKLNDLKNHLISDNFNRRHYKIYFRGAIPSNDSYNYSHGIRQQMSKIFNKVQRKDYLVTVISNDFRLYVDELLHSKICLNPEGLKNMYIHTCVHTYIQISIYPYIHIHLYSYIDT